MTPVTDLGELRGERASQAHRGQVISGRGESMCEGPKAEASLACSWRARGLLWLRWSDGRGSEEQASGGEARVTGPCEGAGSVRTWPAPWLCRRHRSGTAGGCRPARAGPTPAPSPARGSHPPDSSGAEGGRGAGGDVRVVLGVQFVLNSVLTRKETHVSFAACWKRDSGDPGKTAGGTSHSGKTTAGSVTARAPPCCRGRAGAEGSAG